MRSVADFSEIYLSRDPVDMRKSIGGLSVMAQEEMGADWKKAQLFVFSNKRRNLVKIVYFDKSGFALWTKRLEESKFSWPKDLDDSRVVMSCEDLEMLLSGINIWTRFREHEYRTVI